MSHFIDEAENKEKQIKQKESGLIHQQGQTEEANHLLYKSFHDEMVKLVNKIAQLSSESRKPVIEIGYTHLEGESLYEYYASTYKTIIKRKFYFFKKESIYNWWRRIKVEITNNPDEIYVRLYEKGTSETNITDVIKIKFKTKVKISKLNSETALWMIDYLGYKISNHELLNILKNIEKK